MPGLPLGETEDGKVVGAASLVKDNTPVALSQDASGVKLTLGTWDANGTAIKLTMKKLPDWKVNDNAPGITYHGCSWKVSINRGAGDYMDDLHYTTTNGDSFSYKFTGIAVDYISSNRQQGRRAAAGHDRARRCGSRRRYGWGRSRPPPPSARTGGGEVSFGTGTRRHCPAWAGGEPPRRRARSQPVYAEDCVFDVQVPIPSWGSGHYDRRMVELETAFRSLDGTALSGTVTVPGRPSSRLAVLVHGSGVTRHEGGFFTRLAAGLAKSGVRCLRLICGLTGPVVAGPRR